MIVCILVEGEVETNVDRAGHTVVRGGKSYANAAGGVDPVVGWSARVVAILKKIAKAVRPTAGHGPGTQAVSQASGVTGATATTIICLYSDV